jgi:predicted nuclease of predicted toxin-antitoxin system
MRWLLHGNLTAAVGEALRRHGHVADSSEKLGIDATDPSEVLKAANTKQLDIITADPKLADAPFANGSRFDRSIVFLQLSGGEVEQDDAIDRLFERYKRLSPRRLYTVTETRVKIRQLPTSRLAQKIKPSTDSTDDTDSKTKSVKSV